MANLYAAIETLTEKINQLEDELNRYKAGWQWLEERNALLAKALCDISDGNFSCWNDIKADTGLNNERCQELFNLINEELSQC